MTLLPAVCRRPSTVVGLTRKRDVDFCCPKYELKHLRVGGVRPRGHIPRVPCDMSRAEFERRFIRPMRPAILVGCDYSWLTNGEGGRKRDLSVAAVTKVGGALC